MNGRARRQGALGAAPWCLLVLVGSSGCVQPRSGARGDDVTQPLRALTMDLGADDGAEVALPNAWNHPLSPRREAAIATILEADPDLLGVQGALRNQIESLEDGLGPRYRSVGVGATDGADAGEINAIFWRNDVFERFADGHFWLSDEPDVPGSTVPGASAPRLATWVELEERASGRLLLVLNTRWDEASQDAREQAAGLIVQTLDLIGPAPLGRVVLGGLAGTEDNVAVLTLRNGARLTDAYREAHPDRRPDEGTSDGFGGETAGERVDHVLVSAGRFTIEGAEILGGPGEGGPPSAHFPVLARLRW